MLSELTVVIMTVYTGIESLPCATETNMSHVNYASIKKRKLAVSPGMERNRPGRGGCHGHSPHQKSTGQDPIRGFGSVASFADGTRCNLSACLCSKVHSCADIFLHPSALPHSPVVLEGPQCCPYGTDERVCLLVPELPFLTHLHYANYRQREPVSPSGYPKESVLDNLTFSETGKGAKRKCLQSSATLTCL